ncbi:MAG: hypothetical protein Q8P33_00530 [bacterium]|nr:hypothetical protein [bacterium]
MERIIGVGIIFVLGVGVALAIWVASWLIDLLSGGQIRVTAGLEGVIWLAVMGLVILCSALAKPRRAHQSSGITVK